MKLLLAGALGVCTSLLLACGSNSKLIPAGNAGPLQGDFDAVASAVSSGDCSGAGSAVQKAQSDLAALPSSTDAALRSRLRQGVDALARRVPTQCTQSTASTASTTTTTTPTTSTRTTTTTDTTTTDTTPSTTDSTPQTTSSTPSTTDTPPVPDNGGGTPAPNGRGGSGGAGAGGGGQ